MKKNFSFGLALVRSIAIFIVFIYHFSNNILPNGYIGVDIFFVLSGFLIYKTSFSERFDNNIISIKEFFKKRIIRIYPPLIILGFLISFISIFASTNFLGTFKTYISTIFGLSNIYLFLEGADYFANSIGSNFLYPFWSLSIEIQFYIFIALLIFIIEKFKINKSFLERKLFPFLTFFALCSFIFFLISSKISFRLVFNFNPSRSYLFSLFRYWELLFGFITGFLTTKNFQLINKILEKINFKNVFAIYIFIIFLISISSLDRDLATTFAVIITCFLFLIESVSEYKIFGNIINNLFLLLGKVSYSFYIIHWPIVAITVLLLGHSSISFIISFITSFILSYASFVFIEVNKDLKTSQLSSVILFFLSLPLINLNNFINNNSFFDSRFLFNKLLISRGETKNKEINVLKCRLENKNKFASVIDACNLKGKSSNLYFVGDSHNDHLSGMFDSLNKRYNYNIFSLSVPGTLFPPSSEIYTLNDFPGFIKKAPQKIVKRNNVAKELLSTLSDRVQNNDLVIISNWYSYYLQISGENKYLKKVINDDKPYYGENENVNYARKKWSNAIISLSNKLSNKDVKLILLSPLNYHDNDLDKLPSFYCINYKFKKLPDSCLSKTYSGSDKKIFNEFVNILKSANNNKIPHNVYLFNPNIILCDYYENGFCDIYDKNRKYPLYNDSGHLSYYGSSLLAEEFHKFLNSFIFK